MTFTKKINAVKTCEDDDDEFYYEVTCPNCQETICLSEDIIEEGQIDCPNCGECLEFDINEYWTTTAVAMTAVVP